MNPMWQKVPQIALCATMSAGKSTLINALLGSSYIPASNFSCTAKIISLLNYSVGGDLIGGKLTADGKISEFPVQSHKTLMDWNNDGEVSQIYLIGELMNIFAPLVLNDTPGTNSSKNAEHMEVTKNFLTEHSPDLIIFVINAEHIGTTDEKDLLIWLKIEIVKKKSAEIIFVANKMDSFDAEHENISAVLFGVEKYLTDLGFKNFHIFPVAAEAALLFRKLFDRQNFTKREKIRLEFLYKYFLVDGFSVVPNLNISLIRTNDSIIFCDKDYNVSDLQVAIHKTGICKLERFINNKFREVR